MRRSRHEPLPFGARPEPPARPVAVRPARSCRDLPRGGYACPMNLFMRRAPREITPDEALPGRDEPMPVPARHDVLGTPIEPPFPEGLERAVFGLGCFWGAERIFWQAPGRLHDRGRLRRRLHAEPDLRGGLLAAAPATPRPCSSSSTRRRSSYEEILRLFWEGHDPTQGMRQGNDVGTQYRSAIYVDDAEQRAAAEASRDAFQQRAERAPATARSRPRSPTAGPVLLRRGLPPAVPREEPERLLRPRRHGRLLPGRRGRVVRLAATAR